MNLNEINHLFKDKQHTSWLIFKESIIKALASLSLPVFVLPRPIFIHLCLGVFPSVPRVSRGRLVCVGLIVSCEDLSVCLILS